MKTRETLFAAALILTAYTFGSAAHAEDGPVKVDISTESSPGTRKPAKSQYGAGTAQATTEKFSATLQATNFFDAPPTVSLKLYAVKTRYTATGAPAQGAQGDSPRIDYIEKVLKQDDIATTSDSATIEIGSVDFISEKGADWYGGWMYSGYVLEVYSGGKLIDTKYSGGVSVRKAYEQYIKIHHDSPENNVTG